MHEISFISPHSQPTKSNIQLPHKQTVITAACRTNVAVVRGGGVLGERQASGSQLFDTGHVQDATSADGHTIQMQGSVILLAIVRSSIHQF